MNKNFYLFVGVLLTLGSCGLSEKSDSKDAIAPAKKYKNAISRSTDNLNGLVKEISQKHYPEKIKPSERFAIIDYVNGTAFDYRVYSKTYDEDGKLIDEFWTEEKRITHYEYDKLGNTISLRWLDNDRNLVIKENYYYNKENLKTKAFIFSSDDTTHISEVHSFYYRGNERKCLISQMDMDGYMINTSKLDTLDREIIEHSAGSSTAFFYEVHHSYDTLGHRIKSVIFNGLHQVQSIYTYKFDSNGNKVQWISILPNQEDSLHREVVRTWVYTYDKHNNWTKRFEFDNGTLKGTTKRKLEYYN